MSVVKVPDIGDFSDVPVIEVLVSVGDTVAAEDPLITLESEKATMDVPAPHGGTVEELLVDVGDTVSEGTEIARIAGGGAGGEAGSEEADGGGADDRDGTDGGGSGDGADAGGGTGSGGGAAGSGGGTADAGGGAEQAMGRDERKAASGSGEPVYASPSVRRIAREQGVDLGAVTGSGRKGRITVEDVEAFVKGGGQAAAAAGGSIAGLDLAPWPEVDHAKYGPIERVELSRIKQISGPNLARNWVHIPHVTHNDEADITDLEAFRKQINSEQDVKVTMVALLIKACVPVLKSHPEVNSSLDGDAIILKHHYHLGFAADTPQGLVVPVIRDVDQKGLLEVAEELITLSGKAREGKLGPAEMAGATFTISSLGGIGGTSFTPIVNAPQVAILGAVRSQVKPIWDAEANEFVPRLMLPLSFSYDHRVIDGAAAARFTAELCTVLGDFRRVLL